MSQEQESTPNQPTEKHEIADYYEGMKQVEMEGHETGIKKARNALFVTAALYLVWEAAAIGRAGIPLSLLPPIYFVIVIGEVFGFALLGFLTKTKPFTAIIAGIILFIALWALAVATAEEPGQAIARGIIIRVVILVNLISALKPAKAWEDLKKNK